MKVFRAALSLALLLAAGAWAAEPARRVAKVKPFWVWCDDGQSVRLEIDGQHRIRLSTGRILKVQGLSLSDILERWPGLLCGKDRLAESIALGSEGAGPRMVRMGGEAPFPVSGSIEILPPPSSITERARILEQISNGSLILPPPLAPTDPNG